MEQNTVFNVEESVTGILANKMTETGIELDDKTVKALVQSLMDSRILEVNKLVDLGDFVHFAVEEDATAPFKTLLLNDKLVYLYEKTRTNRAHGDSYDEFLEDNDLDDEDYPYDQYLRENELVETFPTETYVRAITYNVGDVFLGALKEKDYSEKMLAQANETLSKIQPIVGEHFLPIV